MGQKVMKAEGNLTTMWKRKNRENVGEESNSNGEQMQQGKRKGYSSEEAEGKRLGKKGKSKDVVTNRTAEAGSQPRLKL
jgi:hypothetical protein